MIPVAPYIHRDVNATLNPYALSDHNILSNLLHTDSFFHSRQKTSGAKTEDLSFPRSSKGCLEKVVVCLVFLFLTLLYQ